MQEDYNEKKNNLCTHVFYDVSAGSLQLAGENEGVKIENEK